jgi:hypothetical protein
MVFCSFPPVKDKKGQKIYFNMQDMAPSHANFFVERIFLGKQTIKIVDCPFLASI